MGAIYKNIFCVTVEGNFPQNYPNPFNPTTTIHYDLPEASSVSLVIYDLMGREVIRWQNAYENAGFKHYSWNGKDKLGQIVPAGVYIYQLKARSIERDQQFAKTRKMLLIK
ncbi:MAG: T9SS type A sorting domain-containing protein [Candidatus Marinimicrobia bacterium]|nr:T9SS type A sorting domain-containing protein [Candidatus Neomarinimicrobiota bacterium]